MKTFNPKMSAHSHIKYLLLRLSIVLLAISCSNSLEPASLDDIDDPQDGGNPDKEVFDNDLENPDSINETELGTAEFFNEGLMDDNYILVNDAASNRAYLMDKKGEEVFNFELNGKRLGNDVQLLPDGRILGMFEADNPAIEIGGFGGLVQLLDKDGGVEWSYLYSSENYIAHHDAEMLPNGNIIFQTWERKTAPEALEAGYSLEVEVFPDGIIEVNPDTNEIVWQWHAWDHLIQNHDDTKSNFGSISENPQLIDVNFITDEKGDIMHANGLAYDNTNDLIFLSANFFSEVWVIDHSTTTEEAASNEGGNYGKGGDLLYRFGNPKAYGNSLGEVRFNHNHYPNLLTGSDEGRILIFSNGFDIGKSSVYELQLPTAYDLKANTDNEPELRWSFTNDSLYSPKVSGAVKLPNGNRLITEGNRGFWEVTEQGEVVWRFKGSGFFWRGYHFDKNAPEIQNLGL